jgi:predicted Ser/Thr protein kinase
MAPDKDATFAEVPPLPSGTVIGKKFETVRLIGAGGMGRVYLARDLVMGREVAIKTLLPDARRPDFIARFQGEARKLSTVDGHPNIVRVHEWGEDEAVGPYFVMEYLSGQNLRALVRAEGPIELVRALGIVADVCGAVRTCHKMGVIHRDLKAGNVMVTTDSEGYPLIKVLDFGVAKAISASANGGVEVTNPGWLVGTPEYMAPEQVNQQQVTEATDQYAIGVLLYFCLTRRLPFKCDKPGHMTLPLARAIAGGDFAAPRTLRADIPQEVEDIILRAMARLPQQRFASVRELGAALTSLPSMKGRRGSAAWVEYFKPVDARGNPEGPRSAGMVAPAPVASSLGGLSETNDPQGGTIGGDVERRIRELSGKVTSVETRHSGLPVRKGARARKRPLLVLGGMAAAAGAAVIALTNTYGSWAGALGTSPASAPPAAQTGPMAHETPANVPPLIPPAREAEAGRVGPAALVPEPANDSSPREGMGGPGTEKGVDDGVDRAAALTAQGESHGSAVGHRAERSSLASPGRPLKRARRIPQSKGAAGDAPTSESPPRGPTSDDEAPVTSW